MKLTTAQTVIIAAAAVAALAYVLHKPGVSIGEVQMVPAPLKPPQPADTASCSAFLPEWACHAPITRNKSIAAGENLEDVILPGTDYRYIL